MARDVPALGHRVFHVVPGHRGAGDGDRSAAGETGNVVETPLYRVTFDLATGAITSLKVKDGGWEVFSGSGGRRGHGRRTGATSGSPITAWTAGAKIAMTTRRDGPGPGQGPGDSATSSRASPAVSAAARSSPSSRSRTRSTPARSRRRSASITTCGGSSGAIRLVNNEKYVRYQALFPTDDHERQERSRDPLRRDRASLRDRVPRAELGRPRRRQARPGRSSTSACPATSRPTAR